jgi:NAD(P)-dependent dehydrogenase (short-subunit alcohol dehydrogenase family)
MPHLDSKIAVVTGSADGLVGAVARRLAAKGAAVMVAGRYVERRKAATAEIGGIFELLDLADLAAARTFAAAVAARFPRVDPPPATPGSR